MSWIGVDIGGSYIKSCLIDEKGNIKNERSDPTPRDLDSLQKKVHEIYKIHSSLQKPMGVGIGIAGFIDMKEWIMRSSPNMRFLDGVSLIDFFKKVIDTPFTVDNDANMAAWGESKKGAGVGVKNMVHITLGTGVGSGIIIEGNLFHGSSGFGAEFGHTIVNPDGLPCNCGGRGCVETEASASKIVRNYLELTGEKGNLTSEDIYKLAKNGNPTAVEAFRIAGYYLGIGLSNLINLLNPELIVLGGGVIGAGELIMKPVMAEIEKRAIKFSLEHVKIVPALLGNKAGMLGSALWTMENLCKAHHGKKTFKS